MNEFEKSGTKSPDLSRTESRVSLALRKQQQAIDALSVLQNARLVDVSLTTTPTAVAHGLRRPPVGVMLAAGQDGTFHFVWTAHPSNPGELMLVSATAAPPGPCKLLVF